MPHIRGTPINENWAARAMARRVGVVTIDKLVGQTGDKTS